VEVTLVRPKNNENEVKTSENETEKNISGENGNKTSKTRAKFSI